MAKAELEELVVADATAWRTWLQDHHETSPGVWLALHKKGGSVTALTYEPAVLEALCYGWIDGQGRKRDAESMLIRMTPRGARSSWSQKNVERVGRLERSHRMRAAGRAQVEAARADGRWAAAYAGQATAEVPADLLAAIAAEPEAQRMYDVLTRTNRYAFIHRLGSVKREETRRTKIEEYVRMLARHESIYPQQARPD